MGNEMAMKVLPLKRYASKLWALHERQQRNWVNKLDHWDDTSLIRVARRIDEVEDLIRKGKRYYIPF